MDLPGFSGVDSGPGSQTGPVTPALDLAATPAYSAAGSLRPPPWHRAIQACHAWLSACRARVTAQRPELRCLPTRWCWGLRGSS